MPFIKLLILVSISSATLSADWVEADKNIYVDIETIRKNNGIVSYKSLRNMTTMGLNSVVLVNHASCGENKVTELNILYYGQPMGEGDLVEEKVSNKIKSVKPNTSKYKVMKFACDRAE